LHSRGAAIRAVRPIVTKLFTKNTSKGLATFGKDFKNQIKWGAGIEAISGGPSGLKNIQHGAGPYGDIGKTAAFGLKIPKIKNAASKMFKLNTSVKVGGPTKLVGQPKFTNSAPKKINGIIR